MQKCHSLPAIESGKALWVIQTKGPCNNKDCYKGIFMGIFGGFLIFPVTHWLSSWYENCKYLGHEAKWCIWESGNLESNFSSAIIKLIRILYYILPQIVPSEPGCRVGLVWVFFGRQETSSSRTWLLISTSWGAYKLPNAQVTPQTNSIRPSVGGTIASSPGDYNVWPLVQGLVAGLKWGRCL